MKVWTEEDITALRVKARLLGMTELVFSHRDRLNGQPWGYENKLNVATGELRVGNARAVIEDEQPLHRWLWGRELITAHPAFTEFY